MSFGLENIDVSSITGLLGALIGGATSLATTWLTTRSQEREARRAAERTRRELLYGQFMDELAALYASALRIQEVDPSQLTRAFALRGRITMMSARAVVDKADAALKYIVDLANSPPSDGQQTRELMNHDRHDVISQFSRVCRAELDDIG